MKQIVKGTQYEINGNLNYYVQTYKKMLLPASDVSGALST